MSNNSEDFSSLEPRTPPRRHATFPATPATPQFGPFYDHILTPNTNCKPKAASSPANHHNPRKRHLMSTPRQTPYRSKVVKHPNLKPPVFKFADEEPAQKSASEPAQKFAPLISDPEHPHNDRPPDMPGMWYVFRGRRVFRPFQAGEAPLKPVTLFKEQLAQQHISDSEDDTEVE